MWGLILMEIFLANRLANFRIKTLVKNPFWVVLLNDAELIVDDFKGKLWNKAIGSYEDLLILQENEVECHETSRYDVFR